MVLVTFPRLTLLAIAKENLSRQDKKIRKRNATIWDDSANGFKRVLSAAVILSTSLLLLHK